MIYKAAVTSVKGTARHLTVTRDVTHEVRYIAIEEQDGMFYVLRYDEHGTCVADTAHVSHAEARRQAEFEYELIWDSGSTREASD